MEYKIDTKELIKLVKESKYVEASLNNGLFNATHLISFGGRKLFDTGVDSQEVSWFEKEFLSFYIYAKWKIDQIIN